MNTPDNQLAGQAPDLTHPIVWPEDRPHEKEPEICFETVNGKRVLCRTCGGRGVVPGDLIIDPFLKRPEKPRVSGGHTPNHLIPMRRWTHCPNRAESDAHRVLGDLTEHGMVDTTPLICGSRHLIVSGESREVQRHLARFVKEVYQYLKQKGQSIKWTKTTDAELVDLHWSDKTADEDDRSKASKRMAEINETFVLILYTGEQRSKHATCPSKVVDLLVRRSSKCITIVVESQSRPLRQGQGGAYSWSHDLDATFKDLAYKRVEVKPASSTDIIF